MVLFLRSLILGYAVAIVAAAWLLASGMGLWAVCLVAWIGGNVLGLAFTAIGAILWPTTAEESQRLAAIEADVRLWDADLARQFDDREAMSELVQVRPASPAQDRRRLAG